MESLGEVISWLMLLIILPPRTTSLRRMHIVHSWGPCEFVFPSEEARLKLLESRALIQGNYVPFDVDVDPVGGRIFLSIPSLLPGSPVALATVADRQRIESPTLTPYPDWNWHANNSGCDGMTSVFRTCVDECRRLWVVDSGICELMTSRHQCCPPQLLVFDLATDRLLRRHRFEGLKPEALILSVVAEQIADDCGDDVFAYIADAGTHQLLVYSMKEDRSWSVPSNLFFPDVNWRFFHVGNVSCEIMDGVLGLSLSPVLQGSEDRLLFFHPFSSVHEGFVRTSVLRNSSNFPEPGVNTMPNSFRFIGRRHSQVASEAMSQDGIQFFSEWSRFSISCWNSRMPYYEGFFGEVEFDEGVVRAVTGMKMVRRMMDARPKAEDEGKSAAAAETDPDDEELWVLANNAHNIFNTSFIGNASNTVYLLKARKDALIAGTVCAL